MNTLAIDPGSAGKGLACAMFFDKRLTDVFFAKPRSFPATMPADVRRVVIEKPQADERSKNVSPRSLISLSWAGGIAVGACMARYPKAAVQEVTPNTWKGSTPKPQQHRRLWLLLSPQERLILGGEATWCAIEMACERGGLSRWSKPGATYYGKDDIHNLLDAAALGAWLVGRLRK